MINWEVFNKNVKTILNKPKGFSSFREVAVDSRKVMPGDLFIPLSGERTDGHHFIEAAFQNGAAGVIVSRAFYEDHPEIAAAVDHAEDKVVGLVPDTLETLQKMAKEAMRRQEKGIIKVAVTGSNGKTTTKELIGSVLSKLGTTFISRGNLNSEIGLCQEALRVNGDEKYAVFEMGMNRKGEMDILADIVRPDIGLITNIGTAHIGFMGSIEAIAEEKKKIFSYFTEKEVAFIYEDEPFYSFLADGVKAVVKPFGKKSSGKDITETDEGLKGSRIRFPEGEIRFPLIGAYNRKNMYAAFAVGKHLGASFHQMKEALEQVQPLFGRGQILEGEWTVILDCYNANKDSMLEALDLLAAIVWRGRKVAVLGEMAELGNYTENIHGEIGEYASGMPFDCVLFYGEKMRAAYEAAIACGVARREENRVMDRFLFCPGVDCLARQIEGMLSPGDLMLVKGSRSNELEKVIRKMDGIGKGVVEEKSAC